MTTLLVDSDHFTRGLIAQMLRGFGMEPAAVYDSGRAAKAHLAHHVADLCILEATFSDMNGADLVRWIRRQEKSPIRFVPIIVLTSYTQHRQVTVARDAGANVVLRKPVSPQIHFDHIAWVAKVPRSFIEAGNYAGPDRRFRDIEPPDGQKKRENDFTEIDDATEQDEPGEPAGAPKKGSVTG
ncbi:MAG: response regulator [Rhizomicrobium sp.]